MFKVQAQQCASCIYRPDSPLDLQQLETAIADPHLEGRFRGHRICHHSKDVCCRGFWDAHKDHMTGLGQIAQRLNMVQFVDVDTMVPR